MAKIVWTNESLNWLQCIHSYIKEQNIFAADKVINGIKQHARLLKLFPQMRYLYPAKNKHEIRVLLYGHYRILYLIEKQAIYIFGIYHNALKIEEYFKPELVEV